MTDPCELNECSDAGGFWKWGCLWRLLPLLLLGLLAFFLYSCNGKEATDVEPTTKATATATVVIEATQEPTAEAEVEPTAEATEEPTAEPTAEATEEPTAEPVALNIPAVAAGAGAFGTLLTAVDAAGLNEALDAEGPFTVFAPTDGAFDALPEGALDNLLADKEALTAVLGNHVVVGKYEAADLEPGMKLETLAGTTLVVDSDGDSLTINGVPIATADVEADNGVIHVIESVILPSGAPEAETPAEETEAETPAEETEAEVPVEDVSADNILPVINTTTFPEGSNDLTIGGTGEPGTTLLVEVNGEEFGEVVVGDDGSWAIENEIGSGQYEVKAYEMNDGIPSDTSNAVDILIPGK